MLRFLFERKYDMSLNSGNAAINEAYNPEIKSPDYLGHKPKNNAEVVRIGRKPIILVGPLLKCYCQRYDLYRRNEIYCRAASSRRGE